MWPYSGSYRNISGAPASTRVSSWEFTTASEKSLFILEVPIAFSIHKAQFSGT